MELYLVRHGIAADRSPSGDDANRSLTSEGIERMREAAAGLRRLKIAPQLLLSSPFARARQTAEILAQALGVEAQIDDGMVPGFDLERLQALAPRFHDRKRIMLVGHEPDLSDLAQALCGGHIEMKKGSCCVIELEEIERAMGILTMLLPPRAARSIGQRHS